MNVVGNNPLKYQTRENRMKLVDNKVYLLLRHEYDFFMCHEYEFANTLLNVVGVYQDETEAELESL